MSVYKERQKKLQKKMNNEEFDAMLITDLTSIRYSCGFTGSNGLLLLTPNKSYFYTDFRYKTQIEEEVEADEKIVYEKGLYKEVSENEYLKSASKIGFQSMDVKYAVYQKLSETLEDAELVPQREYLREFWSIKDEWEIKRIKKAIEISEKALEQTKQLIEPGLTERELAAELEYRLKKLGGAKPSFDTIFISGERSALVHGRAEDYEIVDNGFVLVDFGTKYKGYCSDITRTFFIGEPTEKHKEIYQIVKQAQQLALDAAQPGMSSVDLDAVARDFIDEKGYGEDFGHSLGHGLGLKVHGKPRISKKEKTDTELKTGMVFTIEPGIYLQDFGGVRIEDDVVMREDGLEVLSSFTKEFITL